MATFTPLEGDPVALEGEVGDLEASVSAIDEAIDLLYSTESTLTGQAAAELYARSLETGMALDEARDRYAGTASALRTYVVEMKAAHAAADAVLEAGAAAVTEQQNAATAVWSATNALAIAESQAAPDGSVEALREAEYVARRRVARAEEAVAELTSAWEAARDRQREAAEVAAAAIRDAAEATDDSFWDGVGDFFAWVGGGLAAVGSWIADAVAAVGEFLVQYAGLVVVFLAIVVVMLVVAALTALTAVGALVVAAVLFAGIAATLLLVSQRQDAGDPVATAEYEVETRTADPEGSGRSATVASYEALFVNELTELDSGTRMRPLYDVDGTLTGWVPREDPATLVRVVALRDEDTGQVVGWRVELPSTQEWGTSTSSLNDLPTDVLHALDPWRETQMETAAWDAMRRAGVLDSQAPVMLTGWSQGGMTAGELAIDDRLAGRDLSVVTGGSPMDTFRHEFAQRDVQVTSFTQSDLVSGLEGLRTSPADLVTHDPDFVQHFAWGIDHTGEGYGALAASTQPTLRAGDERFFANFGEGVNEEVHTYEFQRPEDATVLAPGPLGQDVPAGAGVV